MDQISGTSPSEAPAQAQNEDAPAEASAAPDPSGFGSRGRLRRRARYLRKARELAYRDLGGLVFNLHRFGQRNDALVLAKLNLLGQIDDELRALEGALRERQPTTVLREAGITACPRCAAIHSSEDRFCPNCGLSMGRHPDLPIAGAPAPAPAAPPSPPPTQAPPAAPAPPQSAPTPAPPAPPQSAPTPAAPPPVAAAPARAAPVPAVAPRAEGEITAIIPPPTPGS